MFAFIDRCSDVINTLNIANIQQDQFKIFMHFLISFPLGLGLRSLKSPFQRKLYCIAIGLLFMLYLGKEWVSLVLITTIINYSLSFIPSNIKFLGNLNRLQFKFILICINTFGVLGYLHYDRYINADSSWKLGFNVVQMMLTCRFCYFAAAAQDQVEFSLFDYLGYVFFFPNIIVGTVSFTSYINFINLKKEYAQIPNHKKAAFITLLKALAFTLADQLIRPKFDFNWFTSTQWDDFTLVQRHGLLFLIAFCARFKYFLAFNFAQAAMTATGITYDNTSDTFTNHQLADYRFEIEFNTVMRTKYWNSSIQQWLQTCFYERITYKKLQLPLTFIISAFWYIIVIYRHGYFQIYYFFFVEWALFNEISKLIYRQRCVFIKYLPKFIQTVLLFIFGSMVVNSTAIPVALLNWQRAWKLMDDLGWVVQILMIVVYVVLKVMQQTKSKKL